MIGDGQAFCRFREVSKGYPPFGALVVQRWVWLRKGMYEGQRHISVMFGPNADLPIDHLTAMRCS
jgi:hypothetical protein